MLPLPALLLLLWGHAGRCRGEDGGFTFDGDLRHFAVASNTVFIATEENLYQLNHDLTLVQSLSQRGILNGSKKIEEVQFYRVSGESKWDTTFGVNLLLPFVENRTLITCGDTGGCAYCEVLDLKNISNLLYREHIQVGPLKRSDASVAILVKTPTRTKTYILTAIQQNQTGPEKSSCGSDSKTVNLHNTDDRGTGGIFSVSGSNKTPWIEGKGAVDFVDGFQISSVTYLLSNLPSGPKNNKVRLIWLKAEEQKEQTFDSLRGATLIVPGAGGVSSRLLASSVIPGGPPVLWSGVFSVNGDQTNTELVVFDISLDDTGQTNNDPDFCSGSCPERSKPEPKSLKPKAVLFRQNNMSSVLAVRQKAWMVFFIGTADGQLIKLAVDKNYQTTCPRVLYRADDDRPVFPKLQLDQVDRKHVYVPFRNQMMRVPVSKCSTYTNVQECWSAQDPLCVWCGSKKRCTFEDDCKDSDWLSIPDVSHQRMVSFKVVKDPAGQITVNVQMHVTVSQEGQSNFNCQLSTSSRELCKRSNTHPQFPQCTCILTNSTLPAEGLDVQVRIRLGTVELLEQLDLTDCSDIRGPPSSVLCQRCIKSGCSWRNNSCFWANPGETDLSVCQVMESGIGFPRPEVSSITPSVVSFYGRNHAVLSGHNLSDVTRVRIQAACTAQESPVWNNTGVSLTFHVPSADNKGEVTVCAVLPDGSCHGNAKLTYQSSPSCTKIEPSSSWVSGKRRITVMGSHLEFVEGLVHGHAPQQVSPPRNTSSESLTYDTPAAQHTQEVSTVSVKVANETLACSTKITYHPDPEFTHFTPIRKRDNVHIIIEKKADKLNMTTAELSVWGVLQEKQYPCILEAKETNNKNEIYICAIHHVPDIELQHLLITYGDRTVKLGPPSISHQVLLTLRILLIPCIPVVLVIIYRWRKKLSAETNKL
ncbi:plexin-C1-like [Mastacembelus armatus]|uniref:plexin-C1-like n=1 Tax=Mastacembelus armatus TaxID=205130 RepID=UPI000E459B17|nr:plexin-C1-like [Mastacembelus armatus]